MNTAVLITRTEQFEQDLHTSVIIDVLTIWMQQLIVETNVQLVQKVFHKQHCPKSRRQNRQQLNSKSTTFWRFVTWDVGNHLISIERWCWPDDNISAAIDHVIYYCKCSYAGKYQLIWQCPQKNNDLPLFGSLSESTEDHCLSFETYRSSAQIMWRGCFDNSIVELGASMMSGVCLPGSWLQMYCRSLIHIMEFKLTAKAFLANEARTDVSQLPSM